MEVQFCFFTAKKNENEIWVSFSYTIAGAITWSVQLPHWAYVTAFSQNDLFLDYLFAENRLLELTWVIRKVIRLLILAPLKKISWKESDEEAKCQRWWRARKQEIASVSCVRVVFILRIFIHTVRKGNFATQDWTEAGTTKWREFF